VNDLEQVVLWKKTVRFFNVILAVKAIDLECNEIQKRRGLMGKPLVFHPRLKIGYMLWGVTEDGMYALKKVLIQSEEQLELVRQEIQVSPLFKQCQSAPTLPYLFLSLEGTEEQILLKFEVFSFASKIYETVLLSTEWRVVEPGGLSAVSPLPRWDSA
jgi:hypothetical protein